MLCFLKQSKVFLPEVSVSLFELYLLHHLLDIRTDEHWFETLIVI